MRVVSGLKEPSLPVDGSVPCWSQDVGIGKWPATTVAAMDRVIDTWPARRRRLLLLSGGGLLVLAAALVLASGMGRSRVRVEAAKITLSTVEKGLFKEFIPVTGTVQPIQTVFLDALEGGVDISKRSEGDGVESLLLSAVLLDGEMLVAGSVVESILAVPLPGLAQAKLQRVQEREAEPDEFPVGCGILPEDSCGCSERAQCSSS